MYNQHLIVTGSRSFAKYRRWDVLNIFTQRLLDKYANTHLIHVGDATGVDQSTIQAFDKTKLGSQLKIYGAAAAGGLRCTQPIGATKVLVPGGSVRGSAWAIRDKYMVQDALSGKPESVELVALWDGLSTGTKLTYEHASKLNIACIILIFNLQTNKWSRQDI